VDQNRIAKRRAFARSIVDLGPAAIFETAVDQALEMRREAMAFMTGFSLAKISGSIFGELIST